jgi:peptidoglycan hydrolase CwlO-like protein
MIASVAEAVDNTPAVLLLAGTFVTTVGGVVVAVISNRKVHADNRSDHRETAAKVDVLLEGQSALAADLRDVKADVRDLKASDRTQTERIDSLERPDRIRRIH